MKTSGAAGRSSLFERLGRVISHSPVGRGWRRSSDLELVQRSLGSIPHPGIDDKYGPGGHGTVARYASH